MLADALKNVNFIFLLLCFPGDKTFVGMTLGFYHRCAAILQKDINHLVANFIHYKYFPVRKTSFFLQKKHRKFLFSLLDSSPFLYLQ